MMWRGTEPWQISQEEFPREGSLRQQLRFLLGYAVLAPSGHNTQPWRFRLHDHRVEVYADRTRALPVVDPDDRELTMSCGAALMNLRVAMRHFGLSPEVTPYPDAGDEDLLARVRVAGSRAAQEHEKRMFAAIPERRTNRGPFDPTPLEDETMAELTAAAEAEGAWLVMRTGMDDKARLADLVVEGDRIQMEDRRFRRELAAWIHANRSRHRDGIPGYAMGLGDVASALGSTVVRLFDMGEGRAAEDRKVAEGSPVLAILGTPEDMERHWLAAGQALERVLLLARASGLDASYLNQPIEVESLRGSVAREAGARGLPQCLFRLGRGRRVAPTPRRSVDEVLEE